MTQPIEDPVYHFETSYLKDDAVQHILGTLGGVLRKNWIPKNASPEEIELCDYTWKTIMMEGRESAEAEYSRAKADSLPDEIIAEKLAELQKCDQQIRNAHKILCCMDDELLKGENSELRTDPHATVNPKFPFITIVSLDQWAQKMNFFEPLPSEQPSEMSATKTTNLQITLALLVDVFAKRAPAYRHGDGKPNVNAISNEILQLINDDKLDLPGQGSRSIQNCISAALQIKNNHL